jgi:hypothetical protein
MTIQSANNEQIKYYMSRNQTERKSVKPTGKPMRKTVKPMCETKVVCKNGNCVKTSKTAPRMVHRSNPVISFFSL